MILKIDIEQSKNCPLVCYAKMFFISFKNGQKYYFFNLPKFSQTFIKDESYCPFYNENN